MIEERRNEEILQPREVVTTDDHPSEVRTTKISRMYGQARVPSQEQEYRHTKSTIRSYNLIWLIVGIIEALLIFRFVFEILGANPYSEFTQLVYTLSYPFAEPFRSIFGRTTVANAYFDWSLIVAGVVYLLIGYGLVQLLRIIHPVTSDEVHHRVVV